jgi:PAS domain S-box-containing protein
MEETESPTTQPSKELASLGQQRAEARPAASPPEPTPATLLSLSSVVQASIDSIVLADIEGKIVDVNEATLTMYGTKDKGDLVGKSAFELIAPADRPRAIAGMQEVLAQGYLKSREYQILLKSGAHMRVEMSVALLKDVLGTPLGFVGISRDITARRQAEKRTAALVEVATHLSGTFALQEILHRVQQLMTEVLPCDFVATFYWDPAREVFGLISHYGIAPELLPDAEALAFPPDEPFGGQLTSGQSMVINDITAQAWVPVELLTHFHITALVAVPLLVRGRELGTLVAGSTDRGQRFDTDQVEFCQGIARQVAVGIEAIELYNQQQEEAEIAAVLARVGQEMIASLNTPLILDRLCRLTAEALKASYSCTLLWQPQEDAYRLVASWGYHQEPQGPLHGLKLPHEGVADLVAHLTEAEVVAVGSSVSPALMPEALLRQFALETGWVLRLRRGQELIGFQICGYRERKAFPARDLRIARGISQLASLALANAKLLEELERANHIKEDFVSTMSHELRTPLHIILGYTQLLLEETFGPLCAEQGNILARVDKNARELLELIAATLDLSRLQNQQRLPLAVQAVSVAQLWAELEGETRQLPRKPTIQLDWQLPPDLPLLHTDPIKLKMVLKNLLSNALKFTEAGAVTLTAHRQNEGVEFWVRDTGIGIAPEHVAAIFEPFRQMDSSATPRQGGVGLGLYIVRQLVEVLGGQITVESEEGLGSTFRVWVPREHPVSPPLSSTAGL